MSTATKPRRRPYAETVAEARHLKECGSSPYEVKVALGQLAKSIQKTASIVGDDELAVWFQDEVRFENRKVA